MTRRIEPGGASGLGSVETADEAIVRLMDALERYAGWLASNQNSVMLRAHVAALGTAVKAGTETWHWIPLLKSDIQKLPSGEIPKILRRALTEISTLLECRDVERRAPDLGPNH